MTASKKHHYVPQFILKNFSIDNKKERIYTYQKIDGKSFPQSIRDAGAENYFNTLRNNNLNFESIFDDIDGVMAHHIQQIIEGKSIEFIKHNNQVKDCFLTCMAILYLRGKIWRRTMQSIVKQKNEIVDKYFSLYEVQKDPEISDEEAKIATLLGIENKIEILNALLEKEFVLLEAPANRYFNLSDTPIATLNRFPYSPKNINSLETEVYFPISPKLSLAFFRRGLLEMYKGKEPSFRIDNFCKSCLPIEVSNKQSTTMNYAQIKDSCDYIYSAYDNFNLEKYFLSLMPELKKRESNIVFGEMGEGKVVSNDMPKGINLVLYGQVKSHIISIEMIQKDIRLQFHTKQNSEMKIALNDAPYIKGEVYNYNKQIKLMYEPYFVKNELNGDDFFEMGFNHEDIDQFVMELSKNKNITKEESERLANKYLPG